MSALPAQWTQWAEKFAALTRRERVIVAVAVVLGGGYLIFNFGIDPLLQKARSATKAEAAAPATATTAAAKARRDIFIVGLSGAALAQ